MYKVIYVVKCMVYLCSKVAYKLSLATTTVALEKQMNRCNVKAEKVQCESWKGAMWKLKRCNVKVEKVEGGSWTGEYTMWI